MVQQRYDENCRGCRISRGLELPCGGIIELPGNWILNHYQGYEAFLGWLVLQPKFDRMELSALTEGEAKALGPNIKRIDEALRGYWGQTFSKDPIERVYIVYFFESAYQWPPSRYHLHLHLITRPRSFRGLQKNGHSLVGWRIHDVKTHPFFPVYYRPAEENVNKLMDALRQRLSPSS